MSGCSAIESFGFGAGYCSAPSPKNRAGFPPTRGCQYTLTKIALIAGFDVPLSRILTPADSVSMGILGRCGSHPVLAASCRDLRSLAFAALVLAATLATVASNTLWSDEAGDLPTPAQVTPGRLPPWTGRRKHGHVGGLIETNSSLFVHFDGIVAAASLPATASAARAAGMVMLDQSIQSGSAPVSVWFALRFHGNRTAASRLGGVTRAEMELYAMRARMQRSLPFGGATSATAEQRVAQFSTIQAQFDAVESRQGADELSAEASGAAWLPPTDGLCGTNPAAAQREAPGAYALHMAGHGGPGIGRSCPSDGRDPGPIWSLSGLAADERPHAAVLVAAPGVPAGVNVAAARGGGIFRPRVLGAWYYEPTSRSWVEWAGVAVRVVDGPSSRAWPDAVAVSLGLGRPAAWPRWLQRAVWPHGALAPPSSLSMRAFVEASKPAPSHPMRMMPRTIVDQLAVSSPSCEGPMCRPMGRPEVDLRDWLRSSEAMCSMAHEAATPGNAAVSVSAGGAHTLILLESGCVLAVGEGFSGQLGYGTTAASAGHAYLSGCVPIGGKAVAVMASNGIDHTSVDWGHSAAILQGTGKLVTWGAGSAGQLGRGSTASVGSSPSTLPSLAGPIGLPDSVVAVGLGLDTTMAVTSDGRLFAMGSGADGKLGLDSIANIGASSSTLPSVAGHALIPGNAKVLDVACGNQHTIVIYGAGSVCVFGANTAGQLGTNDDGGRRTCASNTVSGFGGAAASEKVAVFATAGKTNTGIVTDGGEAYLWGSGTQGILGHGGAHRVGRDPWLPIRDHGLVSLSDRIADISLGSFHALFLSERGVVMGTGSSSESQLSTVVVDQLIHWRSATPMQDVLPAGLTRISALSAGSHHSAAIQDDGSLQTFGIGMALLGRDTTRAIGDSLDRIPARIPPVQVQAPGTRISPEGVPAKCLALWAVPPTSLNQPTIHRRVRAVAAGGGVTSIAMETGVTLAWGMGKTGPLGVADLPDDNTIVSDTWWEVPSKLRTFPMGQPVSVLVGSGFAMFAVTETGDVYGSGACYTAIPELRSITSTFTSKRCTSPDDIISFLRDSAESLLDAQFPGIKAFVGELGNGDRGGTMGPPVKITDNVVSIASGGRHTLVLKQDGRVWGWGSNERAQLGLGGSLTYRASPAEIAVGSRAVAVAVGELLSVVLSADGNVRVIGESLSGQRGVATTSTSSGGFAAQAAVSMGGAAVAIGSGGRSVLALLRDGTVRAWGEGRFGALGYGTKLNVGATAALLPVAAGPVPLGGLAAAVGGGTSARHILSMFVSARNTEILPVNGFSIVVMLDQSVRAFGDNSVGQLGFGTRSTYGNTPDTVPAVIGPVPLGGRVVQAVGSATHAAYLMEDGSVRAFGACDSGELGTGTLDSFSGVLELAPIAIAAYRTIEGMPGALAGPDPWEAGMPGTGVAGVHRTIPVDHEAPRELQLAAGSGAAAPSRTVVLPSAMQSAPSQLRPIRGLLLAAASDAGAVPVPGASSRSRQARGASINLNQVVADAVALRSVSDDSPALAVGTVVLDAADVTYPEAATSTSLCPTGLTQQDAMSALQVCVPAQLPDGCETSRDIASARCGVMRVLSDRSPLPDKPRNLVATSVRPVNGTSLLFAPAAPLSPGGGDAGPMLLIRGQGLQWAALAESVRDDGSDKAAGASAGQWPSMTVWISGRGVTGNATQGWVRQARGCSFVNAATVACTDLPPGNGGAGSLAVWLRLRTPLLRGVYPVDATNVSFASPRIASIVPSTNLPTLGGAEVTLLGSSFGTEGATVPTVWIGERPCRSVQRKNDNEIICESPPVVGMAVTVTVATGTEQRPAALADEAEAVSAAAPFIATASPQYLLAGSQNTSVRINGTNLALVDSDIDWLRVGGVLCGRAEVLDPGVALCCSELDAPPDAWPEPRQVSCSVGGRVSTVSPTAFVGIAAPRVAAAVTIGAGADHALDGDASKAGTSAGSCTGSVAGAKVRVIGTGFGRQASDIAMVLFGNRTSPVWNLTDAESGVIEAELPPGSGSVPVTVVSIKQRLAGLLDDDDRTERSALFRYDPPTITRVEPDMLVPGLAAPGGWTVRIHGVNLGASSADVGNVVIGGIPCTVHDVASNGSLIACVVDQAVTWNATADWVQKSQRSGDTAGQGATTAKGEGQGALAQASRSGESAWWPLPYDAIAVTAGGARSALVDSSVLSLVPVPRILTLLPLEQSGGESGFNASAGQQVFGFSTRGGEWAVVTGQGFGTTRSAILSVTIPSMAAVLSRDDTEWQSNSRLLVRIPAGAGASHILVVTTTGGITAESAFGYAPPQILGVSPRSLAASSDHVQSISITGDNLGGGTFAADVRVGGVQCQELVRLNHSWMECRGISASSGWPDDSAALVVSVGGQSAVIARGSTTFDIVGRPSIESVRPLVAQPGSEVTITGRDLGLSAGEVTVWLGGAAGAVECPVLTWSRTAVACRVPEDHSLWNLPLRQEGNTPELTVSVSSNIGGSSLPSTLVPRLRPPPSARPLPRAHGVAAHRPLGKPLIIAVQWTSMPESVERALVADAELRVGSFVITAVPMDPTLAESTLNRISVTIDRDDARIKRGLPRDSFAAVVQVALRQPYLISVAAANDAGTSNASLASTPVFETCVAGEYMSNLGSAREGEASCQPCPPGAFCGGRGVGSITAKSGFARIPWPVHRGGGTMTDEIVPGFFACRRREDCGGISPREAALLEAWSLGDGQPGPAGGGSQGELGLGNATTTAEVLPLATDSELSEALKNLTSSTAINALSTLALPSSAIPPSFALQPQDFEQCASDTGGFLCTACSAGYWRTDDRAECTQCAHFAVSLISTIMLSLGVMVLLALFLAHSYHAMRKTSSVGDGGSRLVLVSKIAITHLQTVSLISGVRIQWPEAVRTMFSVTTSTSEFSIAPIASPCVFGHLNVLQVSAAVFLTSLLLVAGIALTWLAILFTPLGSACSALGARMFRARRRSPFRRPTTPKRSRWSIVAPPQTDALMRSTSRLTSLTTTAAPSPPTRDAEQSLPLALSPARHHRRMRRESRARHLTQGSSPEAEAPGHGTNGICVASSLSAQVANPLHAGQHQAIDMCPDHGAFQSVAASRRLRGVQETRSDAPPPPPRRIRHPLALSLRPGTASPSTLMQALPSGELDSKASIAGDTAAATSGQTSNRQPERAARAVQQGSKVEKPTPPIRRHQRQGVLHRSYRPTLAVSQATSGSALDVGSIPARADGPVLGGTEGRKTSGPSQLVTGPATVAVATSATESTVCPPVAMSGRRLWMQETLASVVVLAFLLHTSITKQAVLLLACTKILPEGLPESAWAPAQAWRLSASPELECLRPDILASRLLLAVPVLLIFTAGLPALLVVTMRRHTGRLAEPLFRRRWGFMFSGFRPGKEAWEAVIMLRKALLAAVTQTAGGAGVATLATLGLIIIGAAGTLHAWHKPFVDKRVNRLELTALVTSAISLLGGIFLANAQQYGEATNGDVTTDTGTGIASACIIGANLIFALIVASEVVRITCASSTSAAPTRLWQHCRGRLQCSRRTLVFKPNSPIRDGRPSVGRQN